MIRTKQLHWILSLLMSVGTALGAQSALPIAPEAREAFSRALEAHRKKNVDAAIDEFLRAYSLDAQILSFSDEGLLDAALTALVSRLAAQPQDLGLNFKLAEITNIKGATDESVAYYQKVLALAPQSPQAAVAREEVRKLQAAAAASRAAASAAALAAASAVAAVPSPETQPRPLASADDASSDKIKQLTEELEKVKEEANLAREKLDKLQKEYDDLNKKSQKWYFYYTRFFADPKNVQNLQGGQ